MAISRGDLTGTKNGSNTAFTIPVTPVAGSEVIYHNTGALYIYSDAGTWGALTAAQKVNRCLISGTSVTVGLAPNSTDDLWYECEV